VDTVPAPDAPANLNFDALIRTGLPDGLGLTIAGQPKPPESPTPLATALIAELKASQLQTASLIADLRQQLGGSKALSLFVVHPPRAPGYLTGAPRPVAAPAPASAPTPPVPQTITLPTDEQMNDADRKRVQTALARLGYYDGKVDGILGPDSRAAIRRYQHELGAEMTGRLTSAQASHLVTGQ
jgi:Putative peptidoglycan binding domain